MSRNWNISNVRTLLVWEPRSITTLWASTAPHRDKFIIIIIIIIIIVIDHLYSQALKLLGLILFITYNFLSLDSLKALYTAIVRSKLEYASVAWNISL
jgi:hypothetical protein